eukprot:CFRG8325T1
MLAMRYPLIRSGGLLKQSSVACAAAFPQSMSMSTATSSQNTKKKPVGLPRLMQNIKKAPKPAKNEKSGGGGGKRTVIQSLPYRDVPDDATPKDLHTNLINFVNLREMSRRRKKIDIPVHCAGSLMQVVALDNAQMTRPKAFSGMCVSRCNRGIASSITLRNVVDGVLLEKTYMIYSPLIKEIKMLQYQRARRAKLYYLDDHPLNESTFNTKRFDIKKLWEHPHSVTLELHIAP